MTKTYLAVAFSLVFLLIGFAGAWDVDVTGDWEMTMATPRGDERTSTVHFEQDGEKITVTMEGRQGDEITGEGTIKGNEIDWTISRSTPRGDMTMAYKGTVDGDTMSGTVEMGDFGSFDWTAKR
ncbi:MAG TPA: hypothetical protein VMW92_03475 [Candidatus Heimdallarchaeota archaeon]|nr:hypothetical protein [Candidatus Heimdallarchaeota archaeon]